MGSHFSRSSAWWRVRSNLSHGARDPCRASRRPTYRRRESTRRQLASEPDERSYALGSIARRADSDYHLAIKLLAHVLRDRAGPWPPTGQATDVTGARVVPETVDAAVTMLGRRRARPGDIRAIDLSGVDLRNVEFSRGSFSYLNLARSNFAGAFLAATNLRHSLLAGAYVDGADLRRADLRHADLTGVDLRRALIEGADLRGATQMRVRFPEPLPADRGVKKA